MSQQFAPQQTKQTEVTGGLPVRTNVRAGLTMDDVTNQAQSLWNQLTQAVTNAVNSVTGSSGTSAS